MICCKNNKEIYNNSNINKIKIRKNLHFQIITYLLNPKSKTKIFLKILIQSKINLSYNLKIYNKIMKILERIRLMKTKKNIIKQNLLQVKKKVKKDPIKNLKI